jgi:hypothetical protein
MLSFPYQVAADDAGDVFVTDTGVKRVRYINAKTAQIDTIAGGGINTDNCSALTSSLQFPIAVGLNASASRLYIADIADNRIRMVALTDTVSKPVLASISPSSGLRNADYAVTLNGSGFLTPSSANCTQGVTTLSISGTGISVSNMNVSSDSSLTATLAVAADALFGTYNITVTTEKGTSNPIRFTVIEPAPTLTSVTPPSAPRGSTTVVTLTGTAFDLSPGATRLVVDGNAIVANNVRIISPTSIAASFTINNSAALTSYSVGIVTPGGTSNVLMFSVDPQPLTILDPMPQILDPTDQTPLRLQLANPSPDPITGRLTVTFLPNAANNADDPGVSLVNEQASTRTVDFVFPPNNNEAQFSLAGISLDAGTVAGTIRLTISGTQESGKNVALSPSIFDVTVPRLVPLITDARILNRTPSGFDVQITGYSDSKEITAASFQFGRAAGTNLQTSTLQVNLKDAFTAYYQSADASAAGGTFVYRQPFMVQGDVNAIESVTVRLSNTQGDSAPSIAR